MTGDGAVFAGSGTLADRDRVGDAAALRRAGSDHLVVATSHVWTALRWQGKSLIMLGGRCAHVPGLFARRERRWPSCSPRIRSRSKTHVQKTLWDEWVRLVPGSTGFT